MSVYANVEDFRIETGFTPEEFNDVTVNNFLNEAELHIRNDSFLLIREEEVSGTTMTDGTIRYYPKANQGNWLRTRGGVVRVYFADSNLDGSITKLDLQVYEYDSQTETDISNQINLLNLRQGFFTLNTGYPTPSKSVKVTYRIVQRPFDELSLELKKASTAYAEYLAMKRLRVNNVKSAITGYSIGEMSVTKNFESFDDTAEVALKKYYHFIWLIKPIYIKPVRIGGFEELPLVNRFRGYY